MRALLASRRLLPEREARGQVQGAIRGRGALETWSPPRAWVRTRSPPLALALGAIPVSPSTPPSRHLRYAAT